MIYEALLQSLQAKGAEMVAQIVIRDDEAIQLAQEMAGLSSAAEVYQSITAGDAKFMGRQLVVNE